MREELKEKKDRENSSNVWIKRQNESKSKSKAYI